MKMRITVEGKKYDVEVEMLDTALPTAAAPAAPIIKPKPEANPISKPETKPGAVIETKAEAKAEHKPDPKVDAKGWHQVSEGKPGEVCAPVSGTVGEVRVKVHVIGLLPYPLAPSIASWPLHVMFPGKLA